MSVFNINQVIVLNNPAPFSSDMLFDITFESLQELKEDVLFRLTYVGSADDEKYDQVLDEISLGPIHEGMSKFQLEVPPPNPENIPSKDLIGVTVVLLTVSYKGKEFCRIGYYVNNEYTDELLKENPPEKPDISKIERNILNDKPRVTLFQIEWDGPISLDTTETDMITENDINENEVLQDDDMNEDIVEDDDGADDDLGDTPQEDEIPSNDEVEEDIDEAVVGEEKKGTDLDF